LWARPSVPEQDTDLILSQALTYFDQASGHRWQAIDGIAVELVLRTIENSFVTGSLMPLLACVLGLLGTGLDPVPQRSATPTTVAFVITGNHRQATSENFVVTSRHSAQDARTIAEFCERCRAKLQKYWCGSTTTDWTPRCEVIIHGSQASYLAEVGAGAGQTFGSSWIDFGADKRPSRRQIDFRGDSSHGLGAVPHEMTHVVLADLLGGRQPPRWADEGMAMLADSHEKQRLHHEDLQHAYSRRTAFRTVELMTLEDYPHSSRVPAFYGQSLSLTRFLATRGDPATFVAFLQDSLDQGYDNALRKHYEIADVGHLERLWHTRPSPQRDQSLAGAE
jgi:hypothetical protein